MGNSAAVSILQQHTAFNASLEVNRNCLLPETHPATIKLVKCVTLYKHLVLDLAPAINKYMRSRSLPEDDDPFVILKYMKNQVNRNPTWVNGKNNKAIVKTSFDGRNACGHFEMTNVDTNEKMYLTSWKELCEDISQGAAANSIQQSI